MARSSLARAIADGAFAEIELDLLLPWHATGSLDAENGRRVTCAMTLDPSVAHDYQAIQRERDAVVDMNEQLGAPSLRPLVALFAAIDADTPHPPKVVAFRTAGAVRYAGPKFRRTV